ncbi:MAG: LytTR family DNA-binding domain-containing protein, partial [bacterium]|nr:LytTR family DNA-binding domain-containing protein [bacterium]
MKSTFNIIICDDDMNFADIIHKRVSNAVKTINAHCNIFRLNNGKKLVEFCQQNISDIILADIDMPGMNGFEAIKILQKQQPDLAVIFITAHEEFAFQAYDYQPFWFVSKRDLSALDNVLIKLMRKIEYRKSIREIVYIQSDRLTAINTEQVMYIKSSGHYLTSYTLNGKDNSFRCGIQQAYDYLKEAGYICAHRSYIVNGRYIKEFNQRKIILFNDEELPISRNKDT